MEAEDTGTTGTKILTEIESGHGTTSKHKTTA